MEGKIFLKIEIADDSLKIFEGQIEDFDEEIVDCNFLLKRYPIMC